MCNKLFITRENIIANINNDILSVYFIIIAIKTYLIKTYFIRLKLVYIKFLSVYAEAGGVKVVF